MPRKAKHLTDTQIRKGLKPRPGEKLRKTGDGNGLCLNVTDGGRWWSWRGVVHGRRVEYGVGSLDLVEPLEARKIALEWSRIAKEGGEPRQARDATKGRSKTFEEVARMVWKRDVEGVAKNVKARDQWIKSLETYAFPKIGKRPIHGVGRADVESVLEPIWREKAETARRVKQRIQKVFAAAIGKGWYERANPVDRELTSALGRQKESQKHHAAVHRDTVSEVFTKIVAADGTGARALAFAILTAARSGEVRGMTWEEVDLEAKVWRIPGERMKAGREHVVPLSEAAVAIVKAMPRVRDEALVFPGSKKRTPMSDMTMAAVLKRLDIDATVHGFRSTFRDWGEVHDVTTRAARELALAHVNKNAVEAAYLRDPLLDQRRELLARWAAFVTNDSPGTTNEAASSA